MYVNNNNNNNNNNNLVPSIFDGTLFNVKFSKVKYSGS
ncbi:hypothetical protein CLP_1973 [Clostridium butyricum E4 str. BoNT E BL5262]|uniref:Uncharacterized protein n=1 Tax=Clostridium butyricum E4 str. BoNT E BL5262 TaxID=632245 RepID=C4IG21_CLOBU|nr:hypothetical protein CLP_1973 [Clostridium butyricum E4 str. BoNT E BL5262]